MELNEPWIWLWRLHWSFQLDSNLRLVASCQIKACHRKKLRAQCFQGGQNHAAQSLAYHTSPLFSSLIYRCKLERKRQQWKWLKRLSLLGEYKERRFSTLFRFRKKKKWCKRLNWWEYGERKEWRSAGWRNRGEHGHARTVRRMGTERESSGWSQD